MAQLKTIYLSVFAIALLAGCGSHMDRHIANMSEQEKETLRGKETISGSFGSGSADFSNAHTSNKAVMIVDPAPTYAEDPPDADGQVILSGYGRYRTDKVKQPSAIGVSSDGGSSD